MTLKVRKPKAGISRVCSFCGQQAAREILVPQAYGKNEDLLVVENVPTVICDNCGKSYFTGATLEGLERILSNRSKLANTRSIPVAQFDIAA